jgi:8-oxo-dGTP diphosphatase
VSEGYPRIDVTVDVVALAPVEDRLHVLVVRRGNPPYAGQWALPGGYLEVDEPLAAGAARELAEETGLDVDPADLRQLGAFGDPDRDPRGRTISVAHVLFLDSPSEATGGDDAAEASWVEVGEVLEQGLAFDHERILGDALRTAT